jgi:large subunit ribosomal protein L3
MKFILGEKQNMTQIFDEDGKVHPVTVVNAGPITVVQVKTKEKDGYAAVQYGYGARKEKNVSKAVLGHTKAQGVFRYLREERLKANVLPSVNLGDVLDVSTFAVGDKVEVSGISKGKGFQGVVKRHGFKGGPRSHGQKHSEREPGSIGGAGRAGGRVAKGMRMAGRMGADRITIKNLKVVSVDVEKNQIFLEGAVPGRRGTLVELKVK